jgi:hypothetical protein
MALRTVSILGGNWNAVTTWVGGVVPLATDTVDFTALSGNLTVNVNTATLSGINFTNYVGTITFNANIQVNTSVNLGTGGYTQAGGGTFGLTINLATTITSNGVSWNNLLTFVGSGITYTLADNLTVTGNIVLSGTSSSTFTGNTLYIGGDLTVTTTVTIFGTTEFVFNGTGTWSHTTTGLIRVNVTINTTGTLTIGTNIYLRQSILTYIANTGTVVTTGSTLNITGGVTTLNTNGIDWNNVTITNSIQTLTSDLNCQNFTMAGATNVTINNSGGNVYILGNLSHNSSQLLSGTASINLIGTGTWNHLSTGDIRNNLNINTSGTLTIGANIYYNTGTLTYIQGEVIATGSTLNIAVSTTLNTNGITWNNISFTGGTQTLLSDLDVLNLTSLSTTINGLFNVNIGGNLRNAGIGNTTGTATLILNGTGTLSTDSNNNGFQNNIIINTKGTITIGVRFYYSIGKLTYITGKVVAKNSTLTLATSTLINCHKINFDNVIIVFPSTITMNEFFSGSPSLVTNISSNSTTSNNTITFQDGFEKIAKFVDISNCTLSKPLQLLVTTNSKRNSRNSGIRYINQSPNGIAKNQPSVNLTTFGAGGLLADPNNL